KSRFPSCSFDWLDDWALIVTASLGSIGYDWCPVVKTLSRFFISVLRERTNSQRVALQRWYIFLVSHLLFAVLAALRAFFRSRLDTSVVIPVTVSSAARLET